MDVVLYNSQVKAGDIEVQLKIANIFFLLLTVVVGVCVLLKMFRRGKM